MHQSPYYLVKWIGIGLFLSMLSACEQSESATRQPPSVNSMLKLLHEQDSSVVQIKLKQCQVSNFHSGQDEASTAQDIYHCQLTVERFDDEFKQSLLRMQVLEFRHDASSPTTWQLITIE